MNNHRTRKRKDGGDAPLRARPHRSQAEKIDDKIGDKTGEKTGKGQAAAGEP